MEIRDEMPSAQTSFIQRSQNLLMVTTAIVGFGVDEAAVRTPDKGDAIFAVTA